MPSSYLLSVRKFTYMRIMITFATIFVNCKKIFGVVKLHTLVKTFFSMHYVATAGVL